MPWDAVSVAPCMRKSWSRGNVWSAPAFVVNDWYLTAYKPIHDPPGVDDWCVVCGT